MRLLPIPNRRHVWHRERRTRRSHQMSDGMNRRAFMVAFGAAWAVARGLEDGLRERVANAVRNR